MAWLLWGNSSKEAWTKLGKLPAQVLTSRTCLSNSKQTEMNLLILAATKANQQAPAAGGRASADGVRGDGRDARDAPAGPLHRAVLVAKLEELDIGRPSTYAAIIRTITSRDYVFKKGSALVPTWLAFAVTRLLELHFPRLIDYGFTAEMEADLDEIAGRQCRPRRRAHRVLLRQGRRARAAAARHRARRDRRASCRPLPGARRGVRHRGAGRPVRHLHRGRRLATVRTSTTTCRPTS